MRLTRRCVSTFEDLEPPASLSDLGLLPSLAGVLALVVGVQEQDNSAGSGGTEHAQQHVL
ncbi:MAG TPA: hypothetical protein VGY76_03285 [Solirubrobacteraceae bacterium]|nr:hypothetical protein [Solirubrobacteraceae bacterium]